MKRQTILELSKLPLDKGSISVDTDTDTLIHKAIYNLSQSGFSRQLPHDNKISRYFIDIVFPVAISKMVDSLSNNKEWSSLKTRMHYQQHQISRMYQVLMNFHNYNLNENPFYLKNKKPIDQEINDFCDKHEKTYFDANHRSISHHSVMEYNLFREKFLPYHTFPNFKSGKLNMNRLLSKKSSERLEWKRGCIDELKNNFSESDFNKTLLRSFADFTGKIDYHPDSPVYGTDFVLDYMPEIISRISSYSESDWDKDIEKLKTLNKEQQQMILDANRIFSKIIKVESTWNKDGSKVLNQIKDIKNHRENAEMTL